MYWKYALEAGAISSYPGAATPVSGWWLPIVMVVAVIPGAEAVSALLLLPDDEPEPLEPQPAAISATAATPAAATSMDLCGVLMSCLPSGVHWPASAGAKR